MPVLLSLTERVRAPVDIFQAKRERSSQPEKGIWPAWAELRGFAERHDGFGQFSPCSSGLVSGLVRLAVDPVQVALTVAESGPELVVVTRCGDRARQRIARQLPLRLPDRGRRCTVVGDHPVGERSGSINQR